MDELDLYDRTRCELQTRLGDRFPPSFDLAGAVTAYAYWVCDVVRNRGKDWASAVAEYVDVATRCALQESRAEEIELGLLRRELQQASGPLLDVGAGWGRLSALYATCGLQATYVEPAKLGCRLLHRNGLARIARCQGQRLAVPADSFCTVVIGWVLHHDAPGVPAVTIVDEVARVVTPGGRVLSVEPLSDGFSMQRWTALFRGAGFRIKTRSVFFKTGSETEKHEEYGFLSAVRPSAKGQADSDAGHSRVTSSPALPIEHDVL